MVLLANWYASANLLLALVTVATVGLAKYNGRKAVRFRHQVIAAYALTVAALMLPFVADLLPHDDFLAHSSRHLVLWSAPTMKGWGTAARGLPALALPHAHASLPFNWVNLATAAALGLGLIILTVKVWRDLWTIRRAIHGSNTIRRFRRVRVLVSAQITVPFSFWLPGRYFVVLPTSLLLHAAERQIAVHHELQHHRQQDTKWLYVYQMLRAVFFWNPLVHLLERTVLDLQEYACDEALVGRQKVSPQAYSRCLLWVAETALQQHRPLVGTASMASGKARNTLSRRITLMLSQPTGYVSRFLVAVAAAASLAAMTAAAAASGQVVHDQRVTMQVAEHMAEVARQDGDGFPIVVNDLVLDQLNRLLGTPDGREYIKNSLARMATYKDAVAQKLTDYGAPQELLALPILESGYRNAPPSENPHHCAGIWQFMAQTARNFGLRVDDQVDERMDVTAQTDAAIRLLSSLNLQFNDWGLALLAYNGGAGLVEKAVAQTGSRDVWELVRKGYENDPHYVAGVVAMVLIVKNQAMLE